MFDYSDPDSRNPRKASQEVIEVLPEVVSQGTDGYYAIDYGRLTPLLLEAIKELKMRNDTLELQLNDLQGLRPRIAEIEAQLDRLLKN